MTCMNYERLRFIDRASDWCGDDLPRVGSVRDVVRYLSDDKPRNHVPVRPRSHDTRRDQATTRTSSCAWEQTDRQCVARELRGYIDNASQPDFGRRARVQRSDIVKALVTLSGRLRKACDSPPSDEEQRLLSAAVRLVARWRLH
jgi:hypothetical protein